MEEETKEKESIQEVNPVEEIPFEDDEDSELYEPEYRFLLKSFREYRENQEEIKKMLEARMAEREEAEDQLAIPRTFTRRRDVDIDSLGTIVDAFPHEFPWIVRIGRNRADLASNMVAGTLISPYYVVTAAQNVAHWIYQDIYVGLGIHNLNSFKDKSEGFKIKVKRMIVNKECSKKGKTEITHDVAVIELEKPAKIGEEFNVAAIDLPNRNKKYTSKDTGWVAGWGTSSLVEIMKPNPTLRKVPVQIWDPIQTNEHLFTHNFPQDSLLAVTNTRGIDFCANIGSPVMVKNEVGAYELAGIVSLGRICHCLKLECQFGYYVCIPYLLEWIKQNTTK